MNKRRKQNTRQSFYIQGENSQFHKAVPERLLNNFNDPEQTHKQSWEKQAVKKDPFLKFVIQLAGIAGIIVEKFHSREISNSKPRISKFLHLAIV